MPDITVTLTDTENKALEYAAASVSDWIDNAATNRARIAIDEIVQLYTARALDEGVQIPTTKEAIVQDAYDREWIKTAVQRNADAAAEAAALTGGGE